MITQEKLNELEQKLNGRVILPAYNPKKESEAEHNARNRAWVERCLLLAIAGFDK